MSRTPVRGTTYGVRRRRMSASSSSSRAPARSILLTKTSVGSRSLRSVLIRTRVCAWTPSTAESSSTAPSRTSRARSTSAMKSECPGVSIRLTCTSPTVNAATAERMVMPRCRSISPSSVRVSPASTLPSRSIAPPSNSSRSVRLVLPASTWARIPMFRVCTRGRVLENSRPVGALRSSEESAHSVSPVFEGLAGVLVPRSSWRVPGDPPQPVFPRWGHRAWASSMRHASRIDHADRRRILFDHARSVRA